MSTFETLSQLDQEKVAHDAREALETIFEDLHQATGWCGDLLPESWDACYPSLREAMAKLYRPNQQETRK